MPQRSFLGETEEEEEEESGRGGDVGPQKQGWAIKVRGRGKVKV